MKCFTNKKTTIIVLIVVILFNFILPTISNANRRVDEIAGGLFLGIAKLLRHVGDLVLEGLQEIFMDEKIQFTFENPYDDDKRIIIKYSPGVIFSGNVPALHVNFFNPKLIMQKTGEAYKGDYVGNVKFIEEGINFDVEGKLNGSDDAVVQTIGQSGIKEKLESKGYVVENFEYEYTIEKKEEMEAEDPNYNGYRITVWL